MKILQNLFCLGKHLQKSLPWHLRATSTKDGGLAEEKNDVLHHEFMNTRIFYDIFLKLYSECYAHPDESTTGTMNVLETMMCEYCTYGLLSNIYFVSISYSPSKY